MKTKKLYLTFQGYLVSKKIKGVDFLPAITGFYNISKNKKYFYNAENRKMYCSASFNNWKWTDITADFAEYFHDYAFAYFQASAKSLFFAYENILSDTKNNQQ